ncbi:MAG: phenylacetate-CoA oxygenase subunit PaaC [Flavobacteriales bacterium]|nr:phenylacetate-CoA oxygenase subunit PaaC [Flavobacteriales bacterium]MCB9167921.1 phenylacetate-CoA oxygenase subunit PaaC [Flavobacteriales bacterium]
MSNALFTYTLRLADDLLVLSHRLSEWCGHGPVLEEDIALTNRALDHLGEARNLLQYAGQVEGQGRSDDDLAFLRNERQYRNVKLVEQPNGDYAHTIARNFLFDAYHLPLMHALLKSKDDQLVAIAGKAVKEATYHLRHSSEWMVRFGDGTDESHQRAQTALDDLWTFTGELFVEDDVQKELEKAGIAPASGPIKAAFDSTVNEVLKEATLKRPEDGFMAEGGRDGRHTEHLGYILAEMQYLQRAYPGAEW